MDTLIVLTVEVALLTAIGIVSGMNVIPFGNFLIEIRADARTKSQDGYIQFEISALKTFRI